MIFEYVNVVLSALSGLGIGYLLLSGKYAIGYPVFFRRVLAGLLLYAITGVVALVYALPGLHLVHALSSFFVAFGCYSLVEARLDAPDDFRVLEGD